jgi:hypothetical protein
MRRRKRAKCVSGGGACRKNEKKTINLTTRKGSPHPAHDKKVVKKVWLLNGRIFSPRRHAAKKKGVRW